jgi:surfactin synthase thioesterase subunit
MISTSHADDAWTRRFHPVDDHAPRLVCFPHAGGSASYYYAFSAALAPRVEALAVQYPGRQDRRFEPAIEDIPTLAERAFHAIRGWTDRPFALFGHSMGAILAFEVAQRLQSRTDAVPLHLFASGRRAPSRHRDGHVHRYDDARLIDELRRVGGTDWRFLADPELRAAVLPVIRSDYRAIERYRYEPAPPLTCPVTVLVGDHDESATVDEASAWREHTTGAFVMRVFAGGHFYIDKHKAEVIDAVGTAVAGTAGVGSSRGGML